MSVRAYKIISIEKADNPTFNVWNDEFIMDKLPMHEYSDGYGTISSIYIEKESIQNLLDNFEKKWKEYINEADEEKTSQRKAEYKEKLEQILKECDEWGVEYSCI